MAFSYSALYTSTWHRVIILFFRKENSLKKAEEEIAALESEISMIDEECAKPENAVNSAKLNELAARQQECRERLETCYETWEDLSMQLDGAKDS